MASPTIERCNKVIGSALVTAMVLYSMVAGAGYVTYGNMVQSNILVNYPCKMNAVIYFTLSYIFLLPVFVFGTDSHILDKCGAGCGVCTCCLLLPTAMCPFS